MNAARMIVGVVGLLLAAGCGGDTGGGSGGATGGGSGGAPGSGGAGPTGGGTDISGWYKVTADATGPCGMTMAAARPPAYLWVERLQDTYYIRYCTGPAEADCGSSRFYDFDVPITDGQRAEGGTAFFSAGCTLSWERTDATLRGAELRVQSRRFQVNKDIPESACNLTAAAALTECKSEETLAATRM